MTTCAWYKINYITLVNVFARAKMKLLEWNIIAIIMYFPAGHLFRKQSFHKEYDYIVVGAGSAGATVASRLAEDKEINVLLLEAGDVPLPNTEIPLIFGSLLNSYQKWECYSEPQKNACQGFKNKRTSYFGGKMLGGTSSLNAMMYVRGNKRDYDHWAQQGCKGWDYKYVLPFFIKSEGNQIPNIRNNGFHGTRSNLTVSYPQYATPLQEIFLEAGKELGYQEVDYNGVQQTGFAKAQFTIRNGTRCSTEKAFLRSRKSNLEILIKAFVTKIKFDDKKIARYVEFDMNNETKTVAARKEIIISAGAIHSPKILMLSGIGPKKHLEEFQIPVVADLPGVGQNLYDHVIIRMSLHLNTSVSIILSRVLTESNMKLFTTQRKGPLTVPGTIEGSAFVKTKFSDAKDDFPDIQIVHSSSGSVINNANPEVMKKFENAKDLEISSLSVLLIRPKSRGWVKLRSSDPYECPVIDPHFFSDNVDLLVSTEGLRIGHRILNTKSFQKYGHEMYPDVLPGCENFTIWSDQYLMCYAQTLSRGSQHAAGTCKMGDPRDKTTVVDHELRVKGVKGLRVADASIMPTPVSGNTNAPCIMIGEKVADMIKKSRKNIVT